jgi:hypothetical protein
LFVFFLVEFLLGVSDKFFALQTLSEIESEILVEIFNEILVTFFPAFFPFDFETKKKLFVLVSKDLLV